MFAHDLHVVLAAATAFVFLILAVEAGARFLAERRPGRFAALASTASLIVVAMTAAGGLAMLVGGKRPDKPLHFVYAVLAFMLVPGAESLTHGASPRRRAVGTLIAGLVALALVARLFGTG